MKILKFSAAWCMQCRALANNLIAIQDKITEIDIEKDENAELVSKYNIMSLPVLVFLDSNDVEIGRLNGNQSAKTVIDYMNSLEK